MSDITVSSIDTVDVEVSVPLEINSGLDTVQVTTENSATVDVEPYEYFLTSSGLYTGQLTGSIPEWLHKAISDELTMGEGNLTDVIINLQNYISSLEAGVNQTIAQIENTNLSMSALKTSIVSRLDSNDAAIYNLETTKVTAAEAQTIAVNLQQSTFGPDVNAYIANLAITQVDANSATAMNVNTLSALYNDQQVSISAIDTVASTAYDWSASSSKFITDPNGIITGWSFADGSNINSTFKITANKFMVVNGTTGLVPFSVDTVNNKVVMNSNVEINGDLNIKDGTIYIGQVAYAQFTSGGKVWGTLQNEGTSCISYVTVPAYTRVVGVGVATVFDTMEYRDIITWASELYYPGGSISDILDTANGPAYAAVNSTLTFSYYNNTSSSVTVSVHTAGSCSNAAVNRHRHIFVYTLHKR